MAEQINLFADASATPPPPPPNPAPKPGGGLPVWFQRMSTVILVIFCVYIGLILAFLPWKPAFWDQNLFFLAHPRLWAVLRLGVVRGVISGLGLLDIWIGLSEAIHYRDFREPPPPKPE